MHRLLPLVAVALVSIVVRAPSAAEPATATPADAAVLAGTWRAVSIEADGSTSNPDDAAKITVVNAVDGGWTVLADGKLVARGTNELQPWSVPKAIDFTVLEDADGPVTERRHLGIYELERNTRRLCFAPPGGERPASFSAPRGSGLVLVTFERIAD